MIDFGSILEGLGGHLGGFGRCFGDALGAASPSSLPRGSQMRFGAVWGRFWRYFGNILETCWRHFGDIFYETSMNKSVRKSMPKQSWKLMKNQCENGLDIYGNFDDCLNVASPKNEFSRKSVHAETIIFLQ